MSRYNSLIKLIGINAVTEWIGVSCNLVNRSVSSMVINMCKLKTMISGRFLGHL